MDATVIGVDVGGTFTDFVRLGPGGLRVDKRPSTPDDPSRAVLEGLTALDPDAVAAVAHGTTVATNALLERKGARTAFVTTAGFGDLLFLGRGARRRLYDLGPQPLPSLVDERDVLELRERVDASGAVLEALEPADIDRVVHALADAGVEAVAVCLLFSYLQPAHERALGAALARAESAAGRPGPGRVSLSVDVLPELREYERASTTVMNAYVGPVTSRYLQRLEAGAAPRGLTVMGSHGGLLAAEEATRLPVSTLLSGPAAGVTGALAVGRAAGRENLLSFDMGGTSTDVALCEGAPPFTSEAEIDGLPVRRRMLAVHTVGAGGGSLARLDEAGGLHVGPQSAGAQPGPACYGRGGLQPTVTDAHALLGRLPASRALAGDLRLDLDAARAAFAPLAEGLGLGLEAAAAAVLDVANAVMERALRRVSVEAGHHPAGFTLLAFGGAGPLHACALADTLGADGALVPPVAGALSALGLAVAPPSAEASRSVLGMGADAHGAVFRALEVQARAVLSAAGEPAARLRRLADLRYAGQSWELTVPWTEDGPPLQGFAARHEASYGFRLDEGVEVVTLRVRAEGRPRAELPARAPARPDAPAPTTTTAVVDGRGTRAEVPLLDRGVLATDDTLLGPAIVTQMDTTTWVAPGWRARVHASGALLLERTRRPM